MRGEDRRGRPSDFGLGLGFVHDLVRTTAAGSDACQYANLIGRCLSGSAPPSKLLAPKVWTREAFSSDTRRRFLSFCPGQKVVTINIILILRSSEQFTVAPLGVCYSEGRLLATLRDRCLTSRGRGFEMYGGFLLQVSYTLQVFG